MPTADFVSVDKHGNVAASIAQHHAQAIVTSQLSSPEAQLKLEKKRQKKYTVAICVVSLSAFFVGLAAIWIEASIVVYLAFLFPLFTGPYVVHQRRKLNKMPTLRHVMNLIRNQANKLSYLNQQLHAESIRLTNQVARLSQAEAKLESVAKQAGSDVDRICRLVRENAETQRQMKVRYCIFVDYRSGYLHVARMILTSHADLSILYVSGKKKTQEPDECPGTSKSFDGHYAIRSRW
jgi:hypothetical protein